MKSKEPKETKLQKEIERRNKLFKGKTNAEKRVLIAKDVISQIYEKRIIPRSGTWVKLRARLGLNGVESLREVVLENKSDCNCCALGGLFLSCTLFNNKVKVKDVEVVIGKYCNIGDRIANNEKFSNGLTSIFEKDQLILIERVFEQGWGYFGKPEAEEASYKEAKFSRHYDSHKDLLLDIMKNIIENEGTFIP